MWVFQWVASLLCLTWTFESVYGGEIEINRGSLFEDGGAGVMALLGMRDPFEIGYEMKRSVHRSAECGIQNSDDPYRKVNASSEDGGRIIGGSDAEYGEFPWQISVQGKPFGSMYRHKCGGAIVSEYIVITAGHCVHGEKSENLQIVAGADDIFHPTGDEQIRAVKSYDSKFHLNWMIAVDDIAVITLEKPFEFNSRIAPACLPNSDFVYNGQFGIVTGWGMVAENEMHPPAALQVVSVPIIPREKCREIYGKQERADAIRQCNICAGSNIGGRDSCQGDSGGPMTCVEEDGRHYLCGIISWGIGCGKPESPGVYTSTACYSSWIKKYIKKF